MLNTLAQRGFKIFLVLVALVGIGINLMLLFEGLMAFTSFSWVETNATVIDAEGRIQRARNRQYVDITYQYEVNDQTYTSEKVCFFDNFFGCHQDTLEKVANEYRAGARMPIYYAPWLPSLALIDKENGSLAFVVAMPIVILGSLIVIVPGLMILNGWIKSFVTRSQKATS